MAAPVPPEVSQLAITHQLGAHRLTLPAAKRLRLILAVGILGLIFGLFGVVIAISEQGITRTLAWAFSAVLVILVGWAVSTSPIVSKAARARQFYLYEHGFVHPGKKGTEVYRYDGVRELWAAIVVNKVNGISTGAQYRYKLIFADNRELKLNNYSTDMERFGAILQHEVARVQVPAWQPTLDAGQTLHFGPLSVSRAGIQVRGKSPVPWSEVTDVTVDRGYVRVRKAGKFLPLGSPKAADVPNLGTFLAFTARLRQG